ncbi:MAG: DUF1232 domain-containing protein [Candidatus Hydrogenedentes bacterium]|nr:DUF1232 domain-containing protein [Candidatus Hydrogenedentota bacterium]
MKKIKGKKHLTTVTAKDVQNVLGQLDEVNRKVRSSGSLREFFDDVVDMGTLIRDFTTGRYSLVPWRTVSAVTVTLTYVFMPLDAIPDLIPGIGLTDDAAVVALCLSLIQDDLEDYRRWRLRSGG